MDYFGKIDLAFREAKRRAETYIEGHNNQLPTAKCPSCQTDGHCPGLACPDCGHVTSVSWAILRDDEFGYEVIALNDRKRIYARFPVNLPE